MAILAIMLKRFSTLNFLLEVPFKFPYTECMKNKNKYIIKSVGFNIEMGGEILDDSKGLKEFKSFFNEGEKVSFEEGLKQLKEYVLETKGEVDDSKVDGYWNEIETKLLTIKDEVKDAGTWKVWGVEYDMSLGVKIALQA